MQESEKRGELWEYDIKDIGLLMNFIHAGGKVLRRICHIPSFILRREKECIASLIQRATVAWSLRCLLIDYNLKFRQL